METTGELVDTVEVLAAPMYDAPGVIKGYFAALIGPAQRTGTRTLYLAAMKHNNDWSRDIILHPTQETCRAEWEAATPCKLAPTLGDRCNIGKVQLEEIERRGLFRERAK